METTKQTMEQEKALVAKDALRVKLAMLGRAAIVAASVAGTVGVSHGIIATIVARPSMPVMH
jgi:hypothetical protein